MRLSRSPVGVDYVSAFRIVRQLLAEKPRHVRDIVKDGILLHESGITAQDAPTTAEASSKSKSVAVPKHLQPKLPKSQLPKSLHVRRGQLTEEELQVQRKDDERIRFGFPAKPVGATKGDELVPEGHPFVSTNFLKRRILPILESQDLIHLRAVHPSVNSKAPSHTRRSSTVRSTFVWRLGARKPLPTKTAQQWNYTEHFDRLLAGESPAHLSAEYKEVLRAQEAEIQERQYAKHPGTRPEREVWQWEGREEGLTTRLQRLHLNTRRQRARPKKERAMVAKRNQMEAAIADAKSQARAELMSQQDSESPGPAQGQVAA